MCWFHFDTRGYKNSKLWREKICIMQSHVMKKVKAKAFKMVYRLALQRRRYLLSRSQQIFWSHKVHSLSSYILRRPQNFAKSPPYFWQVLHRTKVRWRFRKILWPSQNIWTLIKKNYVSCHKNFIELHLMSAEVT